MKKLKLHFFTTRIFNSLPHEIREHVKKSGMYVPENKKFMWDEKITFDVTIIISTETEEGKKPYIASVDGTTIGTPFQISATSYEIINSECHPYWEDIFTIKFNMNEKKLDVTMKDYCLGYKMCYDIPEWINE